MQFVYDTLHSRARGLFAASSGAAGAAIAILRLICVTAVSLIFAALDKAMSL